MATKSDGKTFILNIAQPEEILSLNPAVGGTPYELGSADTQMQGSLGLAFRAAYPGGWPDQLPSIYESSSWVNSHYWPAEPKETKRQAAPLGVNMY